MSKLYFAFTTLFLFFLLSCQKELNFQTDETGISDSTGVVTDTSTGVIPDTTSLDTAGIGSLYQVIIKSLVNSNKSHVFAVEFETGKTRINVYEDDTTNTNPYDKLFVSYEYNTAGYLMSCANDFSNPTYKLTIHRDAKNRAKSWVTYANGKRDTIYFNYISQGSHTVITNRYSDPYSQASSLLVTEYDEKRNPVSSALIVQGNDGVSDTTVRRFQFNTSGDLVRKIVYNKAKNYYDTLAYTYDNSFGGSNAMTNFQRAILGRDNYLINYSGEMRQGIGADDNLNEYFLSSVINDVFSNVHTFLGSRPVAQIYSYGFTNGSSAALVTNTIFGYSYQPNNFINNINVENDGKPYLSLTFRYQ